MCTAGQDIERTPPSRLGKHARVEKGHRIRVHVRAEPDREREADVMGLLATRTHVVDEEERFPCWWDVVVVVVRVGCVGGLCGGWVGLVCVSGMWPRMY